MLGARIKENMIICVKIAHLGKGGQKYKEPQFDGLAVKVVSRAEV